MLFPHPTAHSKVLTKLGWCLSLVFLGVGCGRYTALQQSLNQSAELANADPFTPPSPPIPGAEIGPADLPISPPLPEFTPQPASVAVADVTEPTVKILLDERSVAASGKLGGEIRGRIPNVTALRLVWFDEWNRAVAHSEWTPPRDAKSIASPGRFTLDVSAGLAPKGHKQRLVLIANEAKKGAVGEWKIWAESEFELAVPAPEPSVKWALDPTLGKLDSREILKIATAPGVTFDSIAIVEPADPATSSLAAWYALLKDIGYRPAILNRANQWKAARLPRAVVLPGIDKLNADELDSVRRYAELGVLIITDRGAVGLESEFGLLRENADKTPAGSATLLQRGVQKQPLGLSSADLLAVESGLRTEVPKVTGRPALPPARAMGTSESGSPVVLVHAFSNQRWIFLNLDFSKYVEQRLVPDATFQFPGMNAAEYEQRLGKPCGGEVLRVLLSEMLDEAAGRPEVQIKSAAGIPLRKVWTESKYDRGLRVVRVAAVGEKEPVSVKLAYPLSLYWYDASTAKLIGRGTEISTEIKPNTPAQFNALPYPVTGVKGKIRRLDGGGLLRVTLGVAREDNAPEPTPWIEHELELSLRGPAGYELPQYLERVKTVNGVWDGQFKLALNDPVGDYRLCVKELYSGAKTEIVVTKYESWYSEQFPVKMAPLKDKP